MAFAVEMIHRMPNMTKNAISVLFTPDIKSTNKGASKMAKERNLRRDKLGRPSSCFYPRKHYKKSHHKRACTRAEIRFFKQFPDAFAKYKKVCFLDGKPIQFELREETA